MWVSTKPIVICLLQSLSGIMDSSMEDLARCPGIGERKVVCHILWFKKLIVVVYHQILYLVC